MSISYLKTGLAIAGAALIVGLSSARLDAQTKTLTREFTPIVFDAIEVPPLQNLMIDELTAYRFDAANNLWIAIPFQIDDIDSRGRFFGDDTDRQIDHNDEVAFMPGDTGDRANVDQWLNDAGARQNSRIEVAIEDPLTNEVGYVYFYRGVSNPPAPSGYISYSPPPAGTGADTINGVSYTVANNGDNGLLNYVSILNHSGQGSPDLLDQQKIRVTGVFLVFSVEVTEENGLQYESVKFGGGAVRQFRELEVQIGIAGIADSLLTATFVTEYFPYSTKVEARNAEIPDEVADILKHVRQSIDFNENARNMTFHNAANTGGILIDGVPDSPNLVLDTTGVNWLMTSGQHGAFLVLASIPPIGDTQTLYYHDSEAGGTNDGTTETGDGKSYGDFGFQFDGDRIAGSFSLAFKTYQLPPARGQRSDCSWNTI